jgi:DNA polymerase III delta prime subunit
MLELMDSMWVEKYRPKTLDELVLPEKYKKEFGIIIAKGNLPNLLLSGPPGGGKTTLARVICSKYGVLQNPNDNLLMVNGSAKKSRGIGFVDEVIEPFLRHPPSRDNFRVVFIDESDKLTNDGYDSLRAIIEKYHVAYGRFIFTCNYVSKIPDAVQSRFSHYAFSQIPKDYLMDYAKRILDSEKIIYEEKTVGLIINNLYPDVRKIVNTLQRNALNGKLDVTEESITTNEKKVMSLILQVISCLEKIEDSKIGGIVNLIIEILAGQELEYRNIYTELFFMDKIPTPAKIIINRYSNTHQNCLVPHMHFMAMVFEIIKALQSYRKAVTGK